MHFNKVLITLDMKNTTTMLRSSVSSRTCCQSEIYWAVRRWLNLNNRELSKDSSSNLNSFLLPIAVHYFNMNTAETKVKGLSNIRFASIIFLCRLAGIPVKMKKISTIYAAYMITAIICTSSTFIGMFADVNVHWGYLGRTMTTMRALLSFTNIMWILSYCR
jgi:hypothetical protein